MAARLRMVASVALVMVRGLQTLAVPVSTPPDGTQLTEQAHPALWALVRRLAAVAETEPPDEIYLTAQVNASVQEDTRVLATPGSPYWSAGDGSRWSPRSPFATAIPSSGCSASCCPR